MLIRDLATSCTGPAAGLRFSASLALWLAVLFTPRDFRDQQLRIVGGETAIVCALVAYC